MLPGVQVSVCPGVHVFMCVRIVSLESAVAGGAHLSTMNLAGNFFNGGPDLGKFFYGESNKYLETLGFLDQVIIL